MRTSRHGLNRRQFVRSTALGLAALPFLRTDVDAFGRVFTLPRAKSRVAVVYATDRKRGVADVLKLLNPVGMNGKRVVIKPNFNSADATPASTHNDTLSQLVTEMHERGARSITLGESSGPPVTKNVMTQKGTFDLASDLRFDVVDFEQLTDADWKPLPLQGTHWADGLAVPRLVADAEYLVSTCCLKTHGSGGVFTMSLKLAVGLTPKRIRRAMHSSPDMRRMIAEINTGYTPQLIVLDGIAAFTDGGPSRGELKAGNVMIAGHDRVAVDAVGVAMLKTLGANQAIMSRGVFEQEQIARAAELKLGAQSANEIEIISAGAESAPLAERLRTMLALG